MPKLKFYDLKGRKSFMSDDFKITAKTNSRTGRLTYFAVALSPSGTQSYRIISKEFAKKMR